MIMVKKELKYKLADKHYQGECWGDVCPPKTEGHCLLSDGGFCEYLHIRQITEKPNACSGCGKEIRFCDNTCGTKFDKWNTVICRPTTLGNWHYCQKCAKAKGLM